MLRVEHRRVQRRPLSTRRLCRRSWRVGWSGCSRRSRSSTRLLAQRLPQDRRPAAAPSTWYATAPREDPVAVAALVEQQRSQLQNRSAEPSLVTAFRDTISALTYATTPRWRPITVEQLTP
ncbi:MAG: hypothetical protein IPI34_14240 [bacterium]|nr:hypothetical protein [bacterium]